MSTTPAGTKLRHTVTGLTNGKEYEFQIRAATPYVTGGLSEVIKATPRAGTRKTITLSVTNTNIAEGDSGKTDVTITATLSEGAPKGFGVSFAPDLDSTERSVSVPTLLDNTCTSSTNRAMFDYCIAHDIPRVPVAEGARTATFKIGIVGDRRDEDNETFGINVFPFTGDVAESAKWDGSSISLTIVDDDSTPVLTAIEDASWRLGETVEITAVATDADTEDTISYSWSRVSGATLPADAELDAARLRFTPTATGTYTMRVTASDGVNEDTEDVTITVVENSEPELTPIDDVAVRTGQTVNITAVATDADGDTISYVWTRKTGETTPALPRGTSLSGAQLRFMPTATGTYTMTVTASDGFDSATEEVTITVVDNFAPVLTAIDDVTVRIGQFVDITASATDADTGDTISYAWTRKAGETTPAIPQGTALNAALLTFFPRTVGTYTMTVTASDGNGGSDTEDVTITVAPGETVSVPATLTVAEGAGNATVRITTTAAFGHVRFFKVTYGGDATGAANPANGDYDNDAVTSVAFGASDLTKDIVIPITDDDTPESAETIEVRISGTLPAGFEFGNALTTVTITDNDSIETAAPTGGGGGGGSGGDDDDDDGGTVIASPSSLDVPEGGQGTYTAALSAEPTGQVTVRVAGASGAVTVDVATLTFTPETWNVPQAVTVRAAEDDDARPEPVVTLTHSASGGGYDEDSVAPVSVRVIEDDQVRINVTPADLEVDEGGASAYTVALDSAPSGAVTVAVTGASGDVTVDVASLTFGPGSWRDPQTVRVSAGEDDDAAPDTAVLRHRASGGGYDAAPEAQVAVSVIENDEVGVTVTPTELTVDEGSAGSYTVALESEPLAPVTVTPSSSAATAATVSGALVFTAADWATPQTVTVTGVEDEDSLEDASATVLHAVSGGDYDGVAADSVAVTVRNTTSSKEMERANRAQEVLLPQATAVFLAQSLGAVGERIEGRATGEGGSSGARMGLMPIAPNGFGTQFGQYGRGPRALFGIPDAPGMSQQGTRSEVGGQRLPTPFEMLNGAAFNVMVGQDEDGEAASGGPGIGLWGGGRLLTLSGVDQEVSWDGGLWSAHLGADVQLGGNVLAGVAVSYGESDFDAMSMDEEEGREIPLSHRTRLTVAQPYLAWMTSGGSYGWVSGSYGRGEARVQEEGAKQRRAGMNYAGVAAGARGVLFANSGMLSSGGVTRLAVKTEGASARIHTEAADGLAEQDARVHRVRLLLEGSHEHAFGSGSLTPAVEVGVRHDAGDAAQGAGMEVGGSLRYRSFSSGLTVELRTRGLVTHAEAERREWGFGGLVILTPGQDGRGPFLMLAPSQGEVETRSGQLFDRMPGQSSAGIFGGADTLGGVRRFEAEGGHGFGLGAGALAPYAGVSAAEAGQDWRMGLRYQLGRGVLLGLEGARQDGTLGAAGKSLRLEGSLTW